MQIFDPDKDADVIKKWVEALIAHERTTASELALLKGLNPSTLTRFLNGTTQMLSPAVLSKLATNTPVNIPLSVQKKLDQKSGRRTEQGVNKYTSINEDGIPVWGVHPVGTAGHFKLNAIPVYYIEHTPATNKHTKLAAFYAPDDTMAPRWHAGEPVLFDRAKAATNGDYAMIQMAADPEAPNDDETYLFRKIYKRANGLMYVTSLSEDERITEIPLDRVLEVRHVLNWSDILG